MNYRRPAVGPWVSRALTISFALVFPAPGFAQEMTTNPREAKAKLQKYETEYYIIHADLDVDTVREAAARLRAMAEEYHRRTRGFAGTVTRKLPFYLFANSEDYFAAGAPKDSAGVFNGSNLMAIAPRQFGDRGWFVIQHEGFHQFAATVISPRLPVWVNEGLADYFGEGIWTGDGLVTGVIPSLAHGGSRLQTIQRHIKDNELLPFDEMLSMSRKEWNDKLGEKDVHRNYCQAWAMVHFLVHADDGKYRKEFSGFIVDVAQGKGGKQSFTDRFGRDVPGFEKRFKEWWVAQDGNSSSDQYTQATVATLTSFLARAQAMKMTFKTAEDFFRAALDGKLAIDGKTYPRLWLPSTLLTSAMRRASQLKYWYLDTADKTPPKLVLKQPDGKVFTGSFTLPEGKSPQVNVAIEAPKPASQPTTRN